MNNKELYIQAINKIDDYFEYSNESTKDKKFVMSVIDYLTERLLPTPENITIYYVIENDGSGSAYLKWFLKQESAENYEENMEEGFGESTVDSVETFIGSDIYFDAEDTEALIDLVNK